MSIQQITAREAHALIASHKAVLIDIRESDEFARAHVPGAVSAGMGGLPVSAALVPDGQQPIFMCRSGARTGMHCERLASELGVPAMMLTGGLDAWRQAGLPVAEDRGAPLEMMRQVQIAAGTLILSGMLLAWLVHPGFLAVSAFVGAGLTFAGVTGFCGMARVLAVMPWNRRMAG